LETIGQRAEIAANTCKRAQFALLRNRKDGSHIANPTRRNSQILPVSGLSGFRVCLLLLLLLLLLAATA